MIIAGYILRIRLDINQIAPLFFAIYMNTSYMKSVLKKIAIGSVHQANINPKELQKIIIMLPPIALQNEFADYVKSIDKLKFISLYLDIEVSEENNGLYYREE